nr:MAG TPA: hypothetical protein [Caudoviricetes sp.]
MNTGYTPVQGRGFVRPENQNLQNFAEIIPVISGLIGGSETNIINARALQMLDEKGVNLTYPPDGNQNMSIISESGFYKLIKTKSAPLPERLCEQLTYCAKNESEQWDYINRVAKRHNCRITGKTKATRYGGPSTQATRYPQRMSITNNATFAAGGQCDQSDLVRSKVCNESFFLCSLRNFSRAKAHGANLSDSCSIFLRRLFRAGDNVLVNSLSVIVLSCIAMRRNTLHHGADGDYSGSLALRRWSSSRATVTSCPISSAALTPIFSTCASASSEETKGFSPLPSACRRAISPRMAVTMNPALLSPSSFTDSMPSITSWGTLIVVICDFAFLYTDIVNHQFVMCISLYTKVRYKNTCNVYHHNIMCISHGGRYVSHNERFIKTTKPGSARTLTGLLTKPLNEVTIMAGTQHTQTHPKFIYTFLAVHRDCMADGKNTVHVAADTLVDACEMLNDMGYISATWKGREENTLFIQKCENNFIWRFIALSTAQPRVIHIEATSEQEARQQSPAGCVMVFAARIRQEVHHVQ